MKQTLFSKITWKFAEEETKTDYHFFNHYLTFGTHYKGAGSFSFEFWFEGGCIGFTNFKKWVLGKDFGDKIQKKGKLRSITIRLGKPIISIYLCKESRNRSLEAVKRYELVAK